MIAIFSDSKAKPGHQHKRCQKDYCSNILITTYYNKSNEQKTKNINILLQYHIYNILFEKYTTLDYTNSLVQKTHWSKMDDIYGYISI